MWLFWRFFFKNRHTKIHFTHCVIWQQKSNWKPYGRQPDYHRQNRRSFRCAAFTCWMLSRAENSPTVTCGAIRRWSLSGPARQFWRQAFIIWSIRFTMIIWKSDISFHIIFGFFFILIHLGKINLKTFFSCFRSFKDLRVVLWCLESFVVSYLVNCGFAHGWLLERKRVSQGKYSNISK